MTNLVCSKVSTRLTMVKSHTNPRLKMKSKGNFETSKYIIITLGDEDFHEFLQRNYTITSI